ncbi:flagellin [Natronosalvus halobius]|uniref:flagellin n=1 Tax=Natronosalvus halobius TaxID=2953746 RepID=UPI0020A0C2CF|nr:flagellin [Natronosalvus halobius]USZ70537.1 flagellin [Natronosalvus halobius]
MARTALVHLVLFIAVVSVATLAVGVLVTESGLYADALEDESDRERAVLETELTIVNDPESGATYDGNGTTTVYVKNVGGKTLEPSDLEVVLDGEYVTAPETRVVDGDRWREGTVLEVTIDRPLERGDHRVAVSLDEAWATLEFAHRVVFWLDSQPPATCSADECTVNASEETLTLTMGTDPVEEGVDVTYSLNDSADENVTLERTTGTTDAGGENATVLDFSPLANEISVSESVLVTVDAGWDTQTLVVRIESEG